MLNKTKITKSTNRKYFLNVNNCHFEDSDLSEDVAILLVAKDRHFRHLPAIFRAGNLEGFSEQ